MGDSPAAAERSHRFSDAPSDGLRRGSSEASPVSEPASQWVAASRTKDRIMRGSVVRLAKGPRARVSIPSDAAAGLGLSVTAAEVSPQKRRSTRMSVLDSSPRRASRKRSLASPGKRRVSKRVSVAPEQPKTPTSPPADRGLTVKTMGRLAAELKRTAQLARVAAAAKQRLQAVRAQVAQAAARQMQRRDRVAAAFSAAIDGAREASAERHAEQVKALEARLEELQRRREEAAAAQEASERREWEEVERARKRRKGVARAEKELLAMKASRETKAQELAALRKDLAAKLQKLEARYDAELDETRQFNDVLRARIADIVAELEDKRLKASDVNAHRARVEAELLVARDAAAVLAKAEAKSAVLGREAEIRRRQLAAVRAEHRRWADQCAKLEQQREHLKRAPQMALEALKELAAVEDELGEAEEKLELQRGRLETAKEEDRNRPPSSKQTLALLGKDIRGLPTKQRSALAPLFGQLEALQSEGATAAWKALAARLALCRVAPALAASPARCKEEPARPTIAAWSQPTPTPVVPSPVLRPRKEDDKPTRGRCFCSRCGAGPYACPHARCDECGTELYYGSADQVRAWQQQVVRWLRRRQEVAASRDAVISSLRRTLQRGAEDSSDDDDDAPAEATRRPPSALSHASSYGPRLRQEMVGSVHPRRAASWTQRRPPSSLPSRSPPPRLRPQSAPRLRPQSAPLVRPLPGGAGGKHQRRVKPAAAVSILRRELAWGK